MRRLWAGFVLATVAAATCVTCTCAQDNDAAKQAMAAEAARVAALDRSDVSALEKMLADDLTYVHASGKVDTKASFLAAIRSGRLHYISWTPSSLHARVEGNIAVIDGEYDVRVSDLRMQPQPFNVNIFILTVYARRAGHWQQIAWQSTRDVARSPLK